MTGCQDQSSFSGIIPVKPGWLVGMQFPLADIQPSRKKPTLSFKRKFSLWITAFVPQEIELRSVLSVNGLLPTKSKVGIWNSINECITWPCPASFGL